MLNVSIITIHFNQHLNISSHITTNTIMNSYNIGYNNITILL